MTFIYAKAEHDHYECLLNKKATSSMIINQSALIEILDEMKQGLFGKIIE